MSILFFLILLSVLILGVIVWAFVWAVNHGQFEDLDRAANSILYEVDEPECREHGARTEIDDCDLPPPGSH